MEGFWLAFWIVVEAFFFLAYLIVLFNVVADLFRDTRLGGFAKAVWVFFLVVLPLLTALVYLIARGPGMARRQQAAVERAQERTAAYIRGAAGMTITEQIGAAKGLLDSGSITPAEFDQLKQKALAG